MQGRSVYIATVLLLLLILCGLRLSAQNEDKLSHKKKRNPKIGTRLSLSPAIGFYKTNPNHTANPKSKMSAEFSVKKEFRLDKYGKSFFLFGINYLWHGLHYDSYYFYPNTVKLYKGGMNYDYSLRIHEVQIPIQMKFSFQKEVNKKISSYLLVGYHFRWLVAGKLNVTQNGQTIEKTPVDLRFKIPLINPVNNAAVNLGFGVQGNDRISHRSVFAELNLRYGFSQYYFVKDFAPNDMWFNSVQVMLGVGIKF